MQNTLKPQYGYRIIENGDVLFKRCFESRHFLRIPEAIAVDAEILNEAIAQGVKYVQIFGKESQMYFTTSIKTFKAHCLELDRKFGLQYALIFRYWTNSRDKKIPRKLTIIQNSLPFFSVAK
ncbi:hypothetical protein [Atribacter laminatus]|uniref:Uncharacterized protein n=1 Tax=Atribacter laminatus TaxID=2847778 RepID=A0A7T1ALN3_ATRLM|nr:hypothetical protein [Atribacter laminatus]QPM68194.1 hypothetical protein RT761_01409 [Atribacter laminatus]